CASRVVSVPVLFEGTLRSLEDLIALVGASTFKTPNWYETLRAQLATLGLDVPRGLAETDPSIEMEGLYIKVEDANRVVDRLKWVRQSFLTTVLDSESHWLARPIVPNRLVGNGSFESLFEIGSAP